LPLFRPQRPRKALGISPQAFVSETAEIGPGCNIYPGAYVGEGARIGANCDLLSGAVVGDDCVLGDQCVLHPHAVLYPNCTLGNRVVLHAGAVIGADGFGYRFRDGRFQKIPQLGSVTICDDAEIGACSTIDRGMIGPTVIGEGTKLDNLVMIGHNCEIGPHNVIAAQAGFAGSVTTEENIRFGGQMGVSDHVHIAGNSSFGARSGVHKDMAPGGMYLGTPVTEEYDQIRMVMAVQKLPEMRKQLRQMEAQIEELSKQVRALHAGDLEPLGS
jgi:UDP-3-O-[3-hydroxymyristoyl] glucosamine N-acyltransferase